MSSSALSNVGVMRSALPGGGTLETSGNTSTTYTLGGVDVLTIREGTSAFTRYQISPDPLCAISGYWIKNRTGQEITFAPNDDCAWSLADGGETSYFTRTPWDLENPVCYLVIYSGPIEQPADGTVEFGVFGAA